MTLGDANTGMTEQDRNALEGHTRKQKLDREPISESVSMAVPNVCEFK
jgi:hypothetical protein